MNEARNMGKTSAKGSSQLFIGKIASTLMLALGSIIVGMFINDAEYGLYTIAVVPAATFLLFQDWGVSAALTKYCANYRAAKKEEELRAIIVSGLTFEVITAGALTLLSLLMANLIASSIFNNPASTFLLILASITILSGGIYGCSVGIFVGFEQMKLSTIAMIIAAIVQGVLSPLLVYLGFGALGAMVGFTLSSVASGVTSIALLYFVIFRKLPSRSTKKVKIFQTLKPLLHYGIPLSIAGIVGGLSPQITSFAMASFTDTAIIGNYKIALNFAVFLTFFVYPIQTVLFPAFSKLDPSRDKQLLKTVYASSVKYASLFMVPATIGLIVMSTPLVSTLFGDKWPQAPLFLTLYVVGNLLTLIGNLSYGRLLYATGETRLLMWLNALKSFIAIPLAFLLIPPFGILGVIFSGFLGGLPSMIIGVYLTWRRYETKADFRNSTKIFLASAIAGATTYLFLSNLDAAAWINLTAGVVLFLFEYLVLLPLVDAINQMDVNNLRITFSELGSPSKLLEMPLKLIEKSLIFKKTVLKQQNNK